MELEAMLWVDWGTAGMRVAVIALALVIWFKTQGWLGARTDGEEGIGDGIHRLTAKWHGWFTAHPQAADRALIVSSLGIDGLGLFLIAAAVLGPSFAPFLGVLIVFTLRQVCQAFCPLPPPPGMIWRDPGVPTILVTYGVGNDLFFSGHTALAVLGAIEVCHLAPGWLGALAVALALGEALIVLVLRAHYTLDVVAGAFAAWFAADVAAWVGPWVDGWLKF
ncbi:MAG: hypothetical protein K9N23_21320 [Akkermansiaceae bacterium]|nr:hypothetical protein [Akkermansiaceae bacterium]MCF7734237.1 hypothetical protein [Akkermansiaceae bacterium]